MQLNGFFSFSAPARKKSALLNKFRQVALQAAVGKAENLKLSSMICPSSLSLPHPLPTGNCRSTRMGEISGKLPSLVLQAKKQAAPKVYQWFLCRFISEWELFSSVDFHSTKEGSGNGRVGGRKNHSSSRVCPVINWAKKEKVNLFKPPKFCCNHHDWWSFLVCQFTIGSVCGTGIFLLRWEILTEKENQDREKSTEESCFCP